MTIFYNERSNSKGFIGMAITKPIGMAITKSKTTTTANYNYNYENYYQTPIKEYVFCVSFRADRHGQ